MKGFLLLCLVLVPGATPAEEAASNAEFCSVLSKVWSTTALLEKHAGVSFAETNLQQGRHDPSFERLVSPSFRRSLGRQGCERFGGVLFVVTADRELGITAADTGAQVVPVLLHEKTELIPPTAIFKIRMFGIDEEEGVAFFDWRWGMSARGTMLLELSDSGWAIVFEDTALS